MRARSDASAGRVDAFSTDVLGSQPEDGRAIRAGRSARHGREFTSATKAMGLNDEPGATAAAALSLTDSSGGPRP
jgi:hypothetical protein